MHPKVSICLPVFNGEHYLAAAIESALSQSYENFELLIVDDCSRDTSAEIISEYAKADKRIQHWTNGSNLGLFANYNECIKRASGDYIKPFAQDDLLHPQSLEKCVTAMQSHPTVALLSTTRGLISSSGQPMKSLDLPSPDRVFEPQQPIPGSEVARKCLFPVVNFVGEPSTVMFRRRVAGAGFDSGFHHIGDIEYWLRILLEGDYLFVPELLCHFRCHGASASVANAKGLLGGPDLFRIGRKFTWFIESCGETLDSFLDKSITAYACYVHILQQSGTIKPEELAGADDVRRKLALTGVGDNKVVACLVDELIGFRELAFRSLKLLVKELGYEVWSQDESVIVQQNDRLIKSLEAELRTLQSSLSWRVTRPLREVMKLRSSEPAANISDYTAVETSPDRRMPHQSEANHDPVSPAADSSIDLIAQQSAYIQHLRDAIMGIKTSRSWRLTRSLRKLQQLTDAPGTVVM